MSKHMQHECYALAPNAFVRSCHPINPATGAKRATLLILIRSAARLFLSVPSCNSRDGCAFQPSIHNCCSCAHDLCAGSFCLGPLRLRAGHWRRRCADPAGRLAPCEDLQQIRRLVACPTGGDVLIRATNHFHRRLCCHPSAEASWPSAASADCRQLRHFLGPRDQLADISKWFALEIAVERRHNHLLPSIRLTKQRRDTRNTVTESVDTTRLNNALVLQYLRITEGQQIGEERPFIDPNHIGVVKARLWHVPQP